MRRIRGHPIWTLVDRAQPLALQAATHAFGARRPALSTQLSHDTRTAIAAAAGTMNGGDLGVQRGIGLGSPTWRPTTPLAIAAARHTQNPAKPAYAVLVAMCVDPGVPHRDPFAKYVVAFRRISIQIVDRTTAGHQRAGSRPCRRFHVATALITAPVSQRGHRHAQPSRSLMLTDALSEPYRLHLEFHRVLPSWHQLL
ncbi:hypothetical protein WK53_17105 [Burkholderia ubonensis]|uniref:Uncharacterized protein n=1 Tax=Burkholderia ubonensis TaxID=101571 RepID=A0AAW3N5U2_9BURK|nr:hypothetical protein WK53_17105 [Burkholderia ubonensis]